MLALCYKWGYGVEINKPEAHNLQVLAAEQKFAPAQHKLGQHYYELKNYRDAFRYYEAAAKHNYAPSIHQLGLLYLRGLGVEMSKSLAFHYTSLAATIGLPQSQFNLAQMFILGDGVAVDTSKAAQLYRKAAEQKYANAETKLIDIFNPILTKSKFSFFYDPINHDENAAAIIYHTAFLGRNNQAILKLNFMAEKHIEKLMALISTFPEDLEKLLKLLNPAAKEKIDQQIIKHTVLLQVLMISTPMVQDLNLLIVNYCIAHNNFMRIIAHKEDKDVFSLKL